MPRLARPIKGRVVVDPRYFRPTEVDLLLGDPTKACERLGWAPGRSLDEMIEEMVAADVARALDERVVTAGRNGLVGEVECRALPPPDIAR